MLSIQRQWTLLAAALVTACGVASAQTDEPARPIRIGAFGAGAYNIHDGQFDTYDGILQCGTFNSAQTLGWQAGNVADFPIGSLFGISTRIYYHKARGAFDNPSPVSPFVSLPDGSLVRMQSEQRLDAALDYVMLEALGTVNLFGPLYVAAGPAAGFATRAAFEQEEHITSPQGLHFVNGGTSRTIAAGNFEQQGSGEARREPRIAATGAIGADIPLSSMLVLSPEVAFTFPFTNILSTFDWKVSTLRAGIALKLGLGGEGGVQIVEVPVDRPVDVARPRPVVTLDARNQLADGTRLDHAEIVVTEQRSADVIPLLPYVFFDPASSTLAPRYHRLDASGTASFDESSLRDSVIGVYHDVLNIIGSRMRKYPEATITITGTREPLDDTDGSESLSADRATTVRSYLTDVWGIDQSRIRTSARGIPSVPSNREVEDGREENRRAEITSSDARVLAPVQRLSAVTSVEPAAVVLIPRVQFGDGIADWNATVRMDDGTTLYSRSGSGAPASDLVWPVDADAVARELGETRTTTWSATLAGSLVDSGRVSDARAIPVRKVVSFRRINGEIVRDSILERYALMFFDFDAPKIIDFNEPVVKLVQSRMRTNSSVRVTGLTDRIGAEEYNLALSQRRADAAAKALRSRIQPEELATSGAGEMLIYDNELPEGRFYNRTVMVEIATPINDQP